MLKILSKKEYKRLKEIELTYSKEDLSYSEMVQKFELLRTELFRINRMITDIQDGMPRSTRHVGIYKGKLKKP